MIAYCGTLGRRAGSALLRAGHPGTGLLSGVGSKDRRGGHWAGGLPGGGRDVGTGRGGSGAGCRDMGTGRGGCGAGRRAWDVCFVRPTVSRDSRLYINRSYPGTVGTVAPRLSTSFRAAVIPAGSASTFGSSPLAHPTFVSHARPAPWVFWTLDPGFLPVRLPRNPFLLGPDTALSRPSRAQASDTSSPVPVFSRLPFGTGTPEASSLPDPALQLPWASKILPSAQVRVGVEASRGALTASSLRDPRSLTGSASGRRRPSLSRESRRRHGSAEGEGAPWAH